MVEEVFRSFNEVNTKLYKYFVKLLCKYNQEDLPKYLK